MAMEWSIQNGTTPQWWARADFIGKRNSSRSRMKDSAIKKEVRSRTRFNAKRKLHRNMSVIVRVQSSARQKGGLKTVEFEQGKEGSYVRAPPTRRQAKAPSFKKRTPKKKRNNIIWPNLTTKTPSTKFWKIRVDEILGKCMGGHAGWRKRNKETRAGINSKKQTIFQAKVF